MPKKLKFAKPDARGIPLAELIALHRKFQPRGSLPGNLGDGFLFATNPVFRAVRKEFFRRGFRFTLRDAHDYYSFPLMSLDEAIARKTVPYRKNFLWLEKIRRAAGPSFTFTELKQSELQFNYLFHETAHFIAHSVFFGARAPDRVPKTSAGLLRILLGEAFANTVECVAFLFSEGEIGSYFLDANCHFRTNEKEQRALVRVAKQVGLRRLTRAVLASFLYANYLYEEVGPRERKKIAEIAEVDDPRTLAPAIRVGFELSDIFRTDTTRLHLMKLGFRNLESLVKIDPVQVVLNDRKLLGQFHELVGVVVAELAKAQSTKR